MGQPTSGCLHERIPHGHRQQFPERDRRVLRRSCPTCSASSSCWSSGSSSPRSSPAWCARCCEKLGIDRRLHESDAQQLRREGPAGGEPVQRRSPGSCSGSSSCSSCSARVGALKIPAVTTFMNQVLAYLPNVLVAIVIFVVAAVIAGAVAGAVAKVMGDTPTGKIVATIVPALGHGHRDVHDPQAAPRSPSRSSRSPSPRPWAPWPYGLALAFGLGGRPVAEQMLEDAYRKGASRGTRCTPTSRPAATAPSRTSRAASSTATRRTATRPGPRPTRTPTRPSSGRPRRGTLAERRCFDPARGGHPARTIGTTTTPAPRTTPRTTTARGSHDMALGRGTRPGRSSRPAAPEPAAPRSARSAVTRRRRPTAPSPPTTPTPTSTGTAAGTTPARSSGA